MLNSGNLGSAAAVTAVVAFGIYRRVRRSIGPQPLTAGRQILRLTILGLLCAFLAVAHPLQPVAVAYMASGLIVGGALGWFALRHTEFNVTPQGYFYTPHLYIGLAVTALFVGRMLYRVATLYAMTDAAGVTGTIPRPDSNPLTLGVLFLTASYYLVYCTGLLRWLRGARQSAGAKLPPGAPDGASSTPV